VRGSTAPPLNGPRRGPSGGAGRSARTRRRRA
jgi:hypothetical protein